jgi:H/ACA ribonucleoprotein complex subunit 4
LNNHSDDQKREPVNGISKNRPSIVIDEEPTDSSHGYEPTKRPIDELLNYGVVAVDKQEGPTSHQVVSWVRKILNQPKAGHSGTLDPPVSGLLPIGLGQTTKALPILLLGPKEYIVVARFHDTVSNERLEELVRDFRGEIFQRPPQRSAVKRATRTREIHDLDILETRDNLVLLRVLCEAGTYIRKLIYDMGEVVSCGATMIELRRTRVRHITEENRSFVRLGDLAEAKYQLRQNGDERKLRNLIQPVEYITEGLGSMTIRDSAIDSVCHGAQLAVPGILKFSQLDKGEVVAVLSQKGELVSLATSLMSSNEIQTLSNGLACKTNRVIMKSGTYPRLWRTKEK